MLRVLSRGIMEREAELGATAEDDPVGVNTVEGDSGMARAAPNVSTRKTPIDQTLRLMVSYLARIFPRKIFISQDFSKWRLSMCVYREKDPPQFD
jgi:hypothetical protein